MKSSLTFFLPNVLADDSLRSGLLKVSKDFTVAVGLASLDVSGVGSLETGCNIRSEDNIPDFEGYIGLSILGSITLSSTRYGLSGAGRG